jgi:hypothetical protein
VAFVKMQRFAQMGRLGLLSGAILVLLIVAGCGSSASAPSDPWDVVKTQHNASADYGIVNGDVGQPSQVEVTVVTKPRVTATTHFTIACGSLSDAVGKNKFGPKGMTPLTFRITVPTPENGPASCFVQTGADYPSNVDSTITLLQRDVPTTTTTG